MNLRQVAQHALKVMDDHMYRADTHEFYEAKEALRAALAEPEQEPVAWRTFDGEGGWDYHAYEDNEHYRDEYIKRNGEKYASWIEPLYTAPPEAVEPIAWMVYTDGGTSAYVTDNPNDLIGAYRALPLYTAPTLRKPLTEAEILAANKFMYNQHPCVYIQEDGEPENLIAFARAIERAHGIGEQHE